MKKLLVLLSFIAASAGIYLALDVMYGPDEPPAVPMAQEAASAEQDAEPEEEQAEAEPEEAIPQPKAAKPSAKNLTVKPAEVKLIVREIKFDGVTAFTHDELKGVVSEFIGQELTLEQALAIPSRVTKYYQAHNMVARATLVGSLARDGLLKVGVIETPMKQTQLDQALAPVAVSTVPPAAPPTPVPTAQAAPVVVPVTPAPVAVPVAAAPKAAAPQPVAELLPVVPASSEPKTEAPVSKVAKLEVGEEAQMAARFAQMSPDIPIPEPKKGKQAEDEETEFILKRYAKQSRQYELLVDNYGYEATGRQRFGAGLVYEGAMLQGDRFSFQGIKTQGSQFVQMAYEWATGVEGLKLGANASAVNYDVVNGLQTAVNLSGDALKKGVQIAYDLVSNPAESSTLALRFDTKKLHTLAANTADSAYYNTQVMGIEFRGFEREMAPGGAVLTYDAILSQGKVDMNGSPNQAADLSSEQTGGSFSKLRFSGTILQPLSGFNVFYAGLSVQRANKNLDASEKMYIGGPLGVRAYGVGEGIGSDGEVASLEFRQKLTAGRVL